MDLGRLRAIINDTALIDLAACRTELDHLRIARAALDTRELEVMRRLDEIADVQPSVFPDDELAKAAKTNLGKSAKVRKRKKACEDIPELADALANGDTTGERVDTFANATAGLKPEELEKVAEHGAAIAAAAAPSKPCSTAQPAASPTTVPPIHTNGTTTLPPWPCSPCPKGRAPQDCPTSPC